MRENSTDGGQRALVRKGSEMRRPGGFCSRAEWYLLPLDAKEAGIQRFIGSS